MITRGAEIDIESGQVAPASVGPSAAAGALGPATARLIDEPWSDQSETLLRKWKDQIDKLSELQEMSGYYIRHRYRCLTIPTIMIPFVMTFLSQTVPKTDPATAQAITITNGVMFMLTSCLVGVHALYGYGQLFEKHFSFSARYHDLSSRIESVLSSEREFRPRSTLFIKEIKCGIDNFAECSPKIPRNVIRQYERSE